VNQASREGLNGWVTCATLLLTVIALCLSLPADHLIAEPAPRCRSDLRFMPLCQRTPCQQHSPCQLSRVFL